MSFPSISEGKAASRREFGAGACADQNSRRSTRHCGQRRNAARRQAKSYVTRTTV